MKMAHYSILVMMTAVSLGCSVLGRPEAKGFRVVTGEIRQSNETGNRIWVETLLLDKMDHRCGVLVPGAFKHMGFARLVIGGNAKLVWNEYEEDDRSPPKTVYFDTAQLRDVAKRVRYMKFTYTGDGKWTLQVYDRSETDEGYRDDGPLRTIFSQSSPVVREE